MKRELLILRLLQALIVLQILGGVLSIVTLSLGTAITMFGAAAMIYLGMTIIKHLTSIREVLSYTATSYVAPQQAPVRERSAAQPQPRFAKERQDTTTKTRETSVIEKLRAEKSVLEKGGPEKPESEESSAEIYEDTSVVSEKVVYVRPTVVAHRDERA
jgi:hypothetical protein